MAVICSRQLKLPFITFTVEGVEYKADKNMTWEEWVASDYNPIVSILTPTGSLYEGKYYRIGNIGSNYTISLAYEGSNLPYHAISATGVPDDGVVPTDLIIANHAYTHVSYDP